MSWQNGWFIVVYSGDTHKWMVYNGKSQSKMDDLKVQPFLETPVCQK
jgi:hypothetical protein